MPPTVSVLVPSYNYAHYLPETIESVLSQTFADFELLILDDGSTDNSVEVARAYAGRDSRIKVWAQKNAGVIATVNALAHRATGAFWVTLDSDDTLFPERLAWGLEDLRDDPSLVASFCAFLLVNSHGVYQGEGPVLSLEKKALAETLLLGNCVGACTAFIRASAARRLDDFARDFTHVYDYDRWLRLASLGHLKLRNSFGAYHRQHPGQITHQKPGTVERQLLDVLEDQAECVVSFVSSDASIWPRIWGHLIDLSIKAMDYRRGLKYICKKRLQGGLQLREYVWMIECMRALGMRAEVEVLGQSLVTLPQALREPGRAAIKHALHQANRKLGLRLPVYPCAGEAPGAQALL